MHFRVCALNAAAPGPTLRGVARSGSLKAFCATAAAATAATLVASPQLRLQVPFGLLRPKEQKPCKKKLRLSWLVVDALSGAVGEIASLAVLYPLDTIKVRCQAQGANAGAVLAELRAAGASMATLRALYAGCGSAALCSAVIGAFYLLAFYTVKRVGSDFAQRHRRQQAAPAPPQLRSRAVQTTGSQLADGTAQRPPLNAEGTHPLVASLAGVSASIVASVFEAPMETFKLRAQAGALGSGSNMMGTMLGTALRQGLGALYLSYGAFMIKSIPYDFAELVTYSGMCDLREAAAARRAAAAAAAGAGDGGGSSGRSSSSSTWRERLGDLMASSPDGMGDMIIGAAAGAAAVLCSMPCDVVKTHMDLHHAHRPCPPGANGLLHAVSEFVGAGRQLVAQGGAQALFVGVTPRLLQTMPSTMVYWFAVEGTRRALMQYVDVGGPEGEQHQQLLPAQQAPEQQQQHQQAAPDLQPAAA